MQVCIGRKKPFFSFIIVLSYVYLAIGFGLIYLPAIVSVGVYFENKRSFAMGIAVCGSGLGTLIFPAVMPYIINSPLWFDYDGALLVESAFIFICIIFGVLMVIFLIDSSTEKLI